MHSSPTRHQSKYTVRHQSKYKQFIYSPLKQIHTVRLLATRGNTHGSLLATRGNAQIQGALVCMSRRDIPVCPGDVIICRRSCAEPGSGLFVVHFFPHGVTFSINQWCQVPPCGGNWCMYTSRSSGQNALRTWPWSFLLITRYCFTLGKEWISPNSFLYIYNKNCHQANGDNRHLVPDVPIGLGRDIRDMPIACARTQPDANKNARHIPMYRPVHSAHANKCSHWVHRLLTTRANTTVRLLSTRANTTQFATRANTQFATRANTQFATGANTQFAYSPPEQIHSSPIRHQGKYTVRLLPTRLNTEFSCSPPEQIQFATRASENTVRH